MKRKKIIVFVAVIVVGFIMFAAPAIFFQMGGLGGYQGRNFALLGVVQLVLVVGVLRVGTRMLGMNFHDIGLRAPDFKSGPFRHDLLLGIGAAAVWIAVQFLLLFPQTGGAARPDIANILTMVDGRWANVLWYLPLGVLGGGVAEELYNRGFFITVLRDILGGGKTLAGSSSGIGWPAFLAAALSVVFFAAGHLPSGLVDWVDILIPSIGYAALFLYTGRLTACIVAHSLWNSVAVAGIFLIYG